MVKGITITDEKKPEERLLTLKEDLKEIPISIILNGTGGFIFSVVDPTTIPRAAKLIRKGYIKNISDFSGYASAFIGYTAGISLWTYGLIENFDKPWAWIPVATNMISGASQYFYKKGKEKANQNLRNGGLELKTSE